MGLERRPELRDLSVRTQTRNWPGVLFEGEGHGEGRKQRGARSGEDEDRHHAEETHSPCGSL